MNERSVIRSLKCRLCGQTGCKIIDTCLLTSYESIRFTLHSASDKQDTHPSDKRARSCIALLQILYMKKKYIYILLLLAAVALAAWWFSGNNDIREPERPQTGRTGGQIEINAEVIEPREFANRLTISGSLEANEQVELRSEVSGILRSLHFSEGAPVRKGDILFTIDDTELRAQLRQAETAEKLAKNTEHRARLLLDKEAISVQEYDVAQADYESTTAQKQLIQAQLAKTTIRAPFSGKIGLRAVSVGEYLTPSTVVANLVSTNPLKLQFSVPEKYSSRIRINQKLSFTISGSDRQYEARIYAIEPGIDASTRTLSMRALADNSHDELLPGAFARIELPFEQTANAILIPTQAIIPVQNGRQVFLFKNGRATATMIETEARTSTHVLVTSGAGIGDTVITSGIMTLKDGMPVQVNLQHKNDPAP